MKKLLLSIALVAISSTITAQVGINTTTPEGALDVVSSDSGVIFPRVANEAAVTTAVDGMVIYSTEKRCFKGYADGEWRDISPCLATAVVPATSSVTGKIWMDRNLGATQVATSLTDHLAYGDLYQWGRLADGHQLINRISATEATPVNGTTPLLSLTDTPLTPDFIVTALVPFDWRVEQNDNLWQGVNGINNPCPSGYRIPTIEELDAEWNAFLPQTAQGAFDSGLKFTAAGFRAGFTSASVAAAGDIVYTGLYGAYMSSSLVGDDWEGTGFYNGALINSANADPAEKSNAVSVRCIKDIQPGN